MQRKKIKKFQSIKDMLSDYDFDKKKYITQEFQDYGYRLAVELDDIRNKSLYIKLAKTESRANLEQARVFIKDANEVRSKAKLFMWALAKLRKGKPLYDDKISGDGIADSGKKYKL
jgi:hypothetical protein